MSKGFKSTCVIAATFFGMALIFAFVEGSFGWLRGGEDTDTRVLYVYISALVSMFMWIIYRIERDD